MLLSQRFELSIVEKSLTVKMTYWLLLQSYTGCLSHSSAQAFFFFDHFVLYGLHSEGWFQRERCGSHCP